jgi:hypothetical protein
MAPLSPGYESQAGQSTQADPSCPVLVKVRGGFGLATLLQVKRARQASPPRQILTYPVLVQARGGFGLAPLLQVKRAR